MFKKVVVVAVLTPWFVQQNKCQTTTFLPTRRNADRKDRCWCVTIISNSRESGRQHAAYHAAYHAQVSDNDFSWDRYEVSKVLQEVVLLGHNRIRNFSATEVM